MHSSTRPADFDEPGRVKKWIPSSICEICEISWHAIVHGGALTSYGLRYQAKVLWPLGDEIHYVSYIYIDLYKWIHVYA